MRKEVEQYLEAVAKGVIADQELKGIRASGKSAKSLTVGFAGNNTKGVGALRGSAYFQQQIQGRGPTKRSGGGFLRRAIRKWLDSKDFAKGFDKRKKDSLSYAISKTIHEEGTRRGRDPRYPGLAFEKIRDKHKPKLLKAMADNYKAKFSSDLIKSFT